MAPYEFFGCRRDLLSFPTRRSSDLEDTGCVCFRGAVEHDVPIYFRRCAHGFGERSDPFQSSPEVFGSMHRLVKHRRSEEHTSELQSRLHLVCRLLLERKKYTTY